MGTGQFRFRVAGQGLRIQSFRVIGSSFSFGGSWLRIKRWAVAVSN